MVELIVKKKKWKKLSKCYKNSIKKYNKCIHSNKCSKKTCEKSCWNKSKINYKKCNKKTQKINDNSSFIQLNMN